MSRTGHVREELITGTATGVDGAEWVERVLTRSDNVLPDFGANVEFGVGSFTRRNNTSILRALGENRHNVRRIVTTGKTNTKSDACTPPSLWSHVYIYSAA